MDRLFIGDENWSGNQFKSKFGGFRALGGSVVSDKSYVVGERGPELFTPSQSGTITPNGGFSPAMFQQMIVVMGTLEETVHGWKEQMRAIPKGHMIEMAAEEYLGAFSRAVRSDNANTLRGGELMLRSQDGYS